MRLPVSPKPDEILEAAMRSEILAAAVYSKLNRKVRNILLKEKLKFLILEEKKHKKTLEKLFRQRFGRRKPELPCAPAIPLPSPPIGETSPVMDLFKFALEKEKAAEEFYLQVAKNFEDSGSRSILEYLSRVERSHYYMIQSEIDLLEKFPDYYSVEDFHVGEDLFHVGP